MLPPKGSSCHCVAKVAHDTGANMKYSLQLKDLSMLSPYRSILLARDRFFVTDLGTRKILIYHLASRLRAIFDRTSIVKSSS